MSRKTLCGIAALACLSLLAMSAPGAQAVQTRVVGPAPSGASAVLNQYCLSCHNQGTRTTATASGAVFDRLDSAKVSEAPEIWEKVVRKLRTGTMPPPGSPRPAPEVFDATASWLEAELDRTAQPNPGRPALRRMNRAEYGNAIRDLLDLHVDVESLLLPDDAAFGFDNIGDLLDVSPSLLERYLTAADRVSALAVGDATTPAGAQSYTARGDQSQNIDRQGMPLGTVGGLLAHYTFPLSGEYEFRVALLRNNLEGIRGLEHPHQLEISVDGERLLLETVGGEVDAARPGATITDKSDVTDARLRVRAPIQAGPREVTATFVRKIGESTARLRPFDRSNADTYESIGRPHVETLTVIGPFLPSGAGDTPSRRRIFTCKPSTSRDEEPCARRILSTLAQRAYRRPATAADLDLLLPFYKEGRQKGTFETGIQLALRRLLASPTFVFRAESDPPNRAAARISDLELASRLSFFLWSSIPDDTLLDLAARNRLREPAVLEAQVRRMLADPRADAMAENFAGQWLHLRNLEGIHPNTDEFPDFDNDLRLAFQREAELFFSSIMREDRSVMDFLAADYTFVNERLARHYGIPQVYGSRFRRITLSPEFEMRRGLLGKGGVLMSTSRADRTSPVLRGKWILENLIGSAPPPPPANVPPLETRPGAKPRTIRERMAAHRAPGCVSCHQLIDPLGFALEGFDAVGAWRTHEAGATIDASSRLADGRAVNGVAELRAALASRPEAFVQTLTEKLMTYALGRGLQHYDMPVVRAIVRDSKAKNYSFTSTLLGIVRSAPFQMRSKPGGG
jgi:mono/diheme cytochrome c family protein